MAEGKNFTEGKEIDKQDQTLQQGVKDVYIGVFFDGTNNNMVQTARYKTNKVGGNGVTKFVQSGWQKLKKGYWLIADKTSSHDEEEINADLYEEYEKHNIEGGYTAQVGYFNKGTEKGYSNVAILHDNYQLNKKNNDGKSLFKHFYIEGAGATDTSKILSGNPNGLGFGLGDTGVTALVSKAVKYVSKYINSLALDKSSVTIHFLLFGFSRGSTCARLFSTLATRNKGERIKREEEFSKYYAKTYYRNGRLDFLDDYKKVVEILGIYDTVASIGYLMQKDGEVHPLLRRLLHGLADDYKDNWHYKNVYEYGLYICDNSDKLKTVCHIGAMDEYRENFAFTDVGTDVPENAVELMVPGCHSDVGGGYVAGEEEQEIILTKRRERNWGVDDNKNQDSTPKSVSTKVCYMNPQLIPNPLKNRTMQIKSFEDLGWIENWSEKDNAKTASFGKKKKRYTIRTVDEDDYLKFKRNVGGVYSNITLEMMMAFANKEQSNGTADVPFVIFPKEVIHYPVPEDLVSLGKKMVEVAKNAEKKTRLWIYPDGNYLSKSYGKLRMKYLHFTSTSLIYHMNNIFNFTGAHTLEGTPGNLGNTPNFDLNGCLCRIVYHGDQKEMSDVVEGLHYMYEYNSTNVVKADCDVFL